MVKSGISWWWMKRLLSLVLFLLLILCQLWLLPKNIQWSSDSFAAASITSSWQSTITNVYNGSAFQRSSSCTRIKKIAEWNICWDPIDRAISSRSCLVYSFGIALDDPFTNFMASAGCKVFAFDPAQKYQRDYKPNVTFYQYGLVSGIHDENSYSHLGWGDTRSGQYKTLFEIQRELGHLDSQISALKIDCEGCEWNLFATVEDSALSRIDQILTEFHFTTTLRFDGNMAARFARPCIENLRRHYDMFHYEENPGAWYDRHIDDQIIAAGLPTIQAEKLKARNGQVFVVNTKACCIEMGLVNRKSTSKT